MNDPKRALVRTAHVDSPAAPSDSIAIVQRYWVDRGVAVQQHGPMSLVARPGSRVALRLMGVLTSFGRSRLPMVVTVDVESRDEGSRVIISMKSNEGYYILGRMRIADAAYEEHFTEMLEQLKSALSF